VIVGLVVATALLAQDVPPAIPPVLRRDPAQLPRAAAGRWQGWTGWPADEELDPRARELLGELGANPFGDVPATLERLYAVLELAPDCPDALVFLGLAYFKLQRYGDAIVPYERYLALVPDHPERTHALGHSYYSLGEYERARDHYRRILAVVPQSHEALRGLALAELRLGREDEALGRLSQALRLAPEDFESLLWTARILSERGEVEASRAFVSRALELEPYDPRVWYVEMQTLYALGRDAQATAAEERWRELDRSAQELRRLEAILRIHPRRFDLIVRTVELHRSVGDVPAVRTALDRLERAWSPEVPLCELRAYALDVLWSLEDREGAERAAAVLARDCPDDLEAWRRLELHYGLIKERRKQIEAARRVRELEQR